jgi:hypothetical protein
MASTKFFLNFPIPPISPLHFVPVAYIRDMPTKKRDEKTGRHWIDLAGDTFGRWTVLECTGRLPTKSPLVQGPTTWRCRCSCGRIKENVNYGALVGGTSLSCGCLRGEVLALRAKKHGDSRCKVYMAWQQAKDRCFNSARPSWNRYGGRGITMCSGFRDNYEAFRDALGPVPGRGSSVDRRDNEGNYSCGKCPECQEKGWELNVHWADRLEQGNNRTNTPKHLWNGKLMTLTEIARTENVAYCSFRNELYKFKKSISSALQYCRDRGLTFNERAKAVLEKNPDLKTRPPKHKRVRKKIVPNNACVSVPNS